MLSVKVCHIYKLNFKGVSDKFRCLTFLTGIIYSWQVT